MKKILLALTLFFTQALIINAQEYLWPISNSNMEETYIEYGYERRTYDTTAYDTLYNYEPREKTFGTLSKCSGKTTCNENHYGVDITGIKGNTYEIVSVSSGTVIATSGDRFFYAGTNLKDRNQRNSSKDGGGYGNYVVIQDETGLCFLYAHMKAGSINVTKGEKVFAGEIIGVMGSSGDSGHMHLHFEVRPNLKSTTTNFGGSLTVTTSFNKETTDPTKYIGSAPKKQEETSIIEQPTEETIEKPIYKPVQTEETKQKTSAQLLSITQSDNKIYVTFDKEITVNKEPNLEITIGYYKKMAKYLGTNIEKTQLIYAIDYNEFDVEANGSIYATSYDGDITYNGQKVNSTASIIIGKMNPYRITNVKSFIKNGDVNEDGYIDSTDATLVLKIVSTINTSGYESLTQMQKEQYKRADMNEDGIVDSTDATSILKYTVEEAVGQTYSNISKCDLNKDDVIDELDINLLRQAISNNSTSNMYDINQDNIINENDLKELKNILLKFGTR